MQQLHDKAQAFLSQGLGPFWGGKMQLASGAARQIFDPGKGEVLCSVTDIALPQLDEVIHKARDRFVDSSWRDMKPNHRGRLLWRLADLLEDNAEPLAQLESLNTGMPVRFAQTVHVTAAADLLRYMAGWTTKLSGESVRLSSPGEWHAYTLREPVGVVGQIVPWNAPLLMAVWKIAPALATGCTVVLKPAEATPLTALYLAQLVLDAGFPEHAVSVVTGDGKIGGRLAEHPLIDKVAFTGSTRVGRTIVAAAAASNLKKVSLELGGKSPVIVFDDCDIDSAIPAIAAGIFSNAGQICNAGSRAYVHASIFDRVSEGVADYARKLRLGHGLDPLSEMGPLISSAQLERVASMTADGLAEGAVALAGGSSVSGSGFFFSPTVLSLPDADNSVARDEIFGPVLSMMRFQDPDVELLSKEANNSPYGLAASIFTRDISRAHRLATRIRAGVVGINRHVVADNALPFGGYGQSGWGRERGKEVLELYTETKAVAVAL